MFEDIPINYNEEPIIITENGSSWKRTGYCCHCGDCCLGCPALLWTKSKRSICLDRVNNLVQRCGQDIKTFPPSPAQVNQYPNCTYKFESIK